MRHAFFWCYPWDLEDEGLDTSLGRLAGDVTVDAVAVYAVCGDVAQLRPRATQGPRWMTQEAAAFFHADAGRYQNTRIRPHPAASIKSRNPLEKIAEMCREVRLSLRTTVVCCESGVLAERHPMAACLDAFGDPIQTRLCPSNPDVREYLGALVEDLSNNYGPEAIELVSADFGGLQRHSHPVQSGIERTPLVRSLLSCCFCPSCRQRAGDTGADAEAAAAVVRGQLERCFRLEPPTAASLTDLLAGNAALREYFQVRTATVTSLVRSLRKRCQARLLLRVPTEPLFSGMKIADVAVHCDGFVLRAVDPDLSDGEPNRVTWRALLDKAVSEAGGAQRIDVGLRCHPPAVPDSPSLVRQVRELSEAGHSTIGFEQYGIAPEPCLAWVRQAIRYARRESE